MTGISRPAPEQWVVDQSRPARQARPSDRAAVHEARIAWLAIALSTTAIVAALVYVVGDFVMRTLLHVIPVS